MKIQKKMVLLFYLSLFSFSSQAAEINAHFLYLWKLEPSRHKNESVFSLDYLSLTEEWRLDNEFKFNLIGGWTPSEESDENQNGHLKIEAAYLNQQIPQSPWTLSLGILPSFWNQKVSQLADSKLNAENTWIADLGFEFDKDIGFRAQFESDRNLLGFSFLNGEGGMSAEKSGRKELQFLYKYLVSYSLNVLFGYDKGSYDQYDLGIMNKERKKILIAYNNEKMGATLEVFETIDPTMAIKSYVLADQYDVSSLPDSQLKGQGGAIGLFYHQNEKTDVILTFRSYNPDVNQKKIVTQNKSLGLNRSLSNKVQLLFKYVQSDRSEGYNLIAEREKQLEFWTKIIF